VKSLSLSSLGENPKMSATASPAPPITHYENFPVASWLCPARLRAPIGAIYHFARTADDLADEGEASPAERLQALAAYRQALQSASAGLPVAPDQAWAWVFAPLQRVISTHQLPVQLLHDLLDAFVQDVEKTRDGAGYADQAELLAYCARSANPVGRLLLHLYGVTDALALRNSDLICTALQLINFWQDLSVDLPRGRFYLPADDCARHGVTQAELLTRQATKKTTVLIAGNVALARARMLKGAELVHRIPGRAGWELRLVVQGGLRILDRIEALHFATLQTRPTLRRRDLALMAWRALWM
jgi:squalene synthase HpnC